MYQSLTNSFAQIAIDAAKAEAKAEEAKKLQPGETVEYHNTAGEPCTVTYNPPASPLKGDETLSN